ncbi:MAG: hypothetical protein COZ56_15990 [Armatimonadetes bacterium CG_4_8_14_3_um_filter_58_9]|nr:MAG: hypothetical protein COZ56_15990 [Armatimonadetes bacterium CG_4_8_14_3_um_filter_58_9]
MIPKPVDGANPNLIFSTSLTIIGVFVAILRERFSPATPSDPPLKWHWLPEIKDTGLFIESGWNENLEGRNVRPGIWVDRDQNVYQQVSIGDRDQMPVYQNVRLQLYYGIGETDMILECTSTNRGESMILGSIVQDFLQMSSDEIQAIFGFRSMTPIILNRTTPFNKDTKLWTSPVMFRVQYENRWASQPIATMLRNIFLKIDDKTDPEKYFRDITLHTGMPL